MWSSPIKGTAADRDGFLAKDRAENVMIVDLVRNDLGRVCEWGSVAVPALCAVEEHPGLVHLVSTVEGRLRPGVGWAEAIDATFPPGSVTGAPKLAALDHIAAPRDRRRAASTAVPSAGSTPTAGAATLNVAIRTFWFDGRPACTSAPAAASPGTPTPRASGPRPSSRPAPCSRVAVGDGRPAGAVDRPSDR